MSCLFDCVADDSELELLTKLIDQEVSEHQSSVTHATDADVERGDAVLCQPQAESAASTSSRTYDSVVEDGSCLLNSDPVTNTETTVTETDEQCQYYCCIFNARL